jgi:hypothetical protein
MVLRAVEMKEGLRICVDGTEFSAHADQSISIRTTKAVRTPLVATPADYSDSSIDGDARLCTRLTPVAIKI